MKQWPEDTDVLIDFEELLKPLEKIIRQEIKDPQKSYDYDGYVAHCKEAPTGISPPDFSEDAIEYHKERDRDVISMVLTTAIQLGYAQVFVEMLRI
jgi:hypothetical protein